MSFEKRSLVLACVAREKGYSDTSPKLRALPTDDKNENSPCVFLGHIVLFIPENFFLLMIFSVNRHAQNTEAKIT